MGAADASACALPVAERRPPHPALRPARISSGTCLPSTRAQPLVPITGAGLSGHGRVEQLLLALDQDKAQGTGRTPD